MTLELLPGFFMTFHFGGKSFAVLFLLSGVRTLKQRLSHMIQLVKLEIKVLVNFNHIAFNKILFRLVSHIGLSYGELSFSHLAHLPQIDLTFDSGSDYSELCERKKDSKLKGFSIYIARRKKFCCVSLPLSSYKFQNEDPCLHICNCSCEN